jgi:type IV secretory pathway VirB10-like protein
MAETPTPDKTPAKGVLPKNLQTWILAGIALLVAAVIFFSGGTKTPRASATPPPAAPPAGRPKDLTSQVSEALAQQEADQAKAQQEALVARAGNVGSSEDDTAAMLRALSRGDTHAGALGPHGEQLNPNYSPHGAIPLNPELSGDEELRKQQIAKAYSSLFASQLARSYRPSDEGSTEAKTATPSLASSPAAEAGQTEAPSAQDRRIADLDRQMASVASQSQQLLGMTNPATMTKLLQAAGGGGGVVPAAAAATTPTFRKRAPTTARNQVAPDAHEYVVMEGSLLEAILVTRLGGDFSGPVLAQLSAPVYSRNLQHVLLPAGTRIIGEAHRVEQIGQTRLAVAFHRLVTPDGYSVDLDLFEGLSSRGETALKDQVNNHYRRIFGTSIALGLLGGLSAIGTSPTNPTTLDTFRMGTSSSLSQSASEILNKLLNILPTVTIREGHRMRVWISEDLALPAYDQHRMPGDL